MIMLIDLHERPSSPEAPKSRAFIDKIFSLTGPDGGVVGGEDGISTQRPLKDGGREAWDMIRRLRQNAWQKAGLDPQKLWTEQAQVQAGVAAAPDEYPCASDPYYANNAGSPPVSSLSSRRQLSDFSKMFYNMTRSHVLPNPASSLRPSPLRNQLPPPTNTPHVPATPPSASTPPFPQTPATNSNPRSIDTALATSPLTSQILPPLNNVPVPAPQSQYAPSASAPSPSPSTLIPFMDTASPSAQQPPMAAVPTPPSMVDPNLNFDWDQWDAVFGQHLPVADELMELDPVSGFEFGDLGSARGPGSSQTAGGGSEETSIPMDDVRGPDWYGYC
ncbi:hypothetical protein N8T08_002473 [Aspergillus melleus]|uniref:Uncharacterized protein n=1 Tax=Aspergillus melleus TaxID=138277 RepID=A0ACC3AM57_9EURO|nr:hypothetical protein N8T08_002473 [Aspergillus melleus]